MFDSESTGLRQVYRRADYHDDEAAPLVADAPYGSADARVSPDGARAVFARFNPNNGTDGGISVAPTGGGEPVEITPGSDDDFLPFDDLGSFSPDGAQIVYAHVLTADDNGNPTTGELFVVDADGGTPRPLLSDIPKWVLPGFPPDGSQVLFSQNGDRPYGSTLWVIPAAGGTPPSCSTCRLM